MQMELELAILLKEINNNYTNYDIRYTLILEALLEAKIKLENELKDLRKQFKRKGQRNKEEIDQLNNVIQGHEKEKEGWEIKENWYKEQKNKDSLEIRQINHKNTSLETQISQIGTENECLKEKVENLERKIAGQKEETKDSNELQKKNDNEIIQLIIDKEKLESELRREKEKRRRDNEIWN